MSPTPDPTAEAVIVATLGLLAEKGVKGTTTRAIAERAGVNEVTVFRKFGTKTNLLRNALAAAASAVQSIEVRYTGDVEADLLRVAEGYSAAVTSVGPLLRVVLTDVVRMPELSDATAGIPQLYEALAALIRRYQAEGVLKDEPPQTLLPAFIGPIVVPYVGELVVPALPLREVAFDARAHVRRFLYGRAE